MISKSTTEMVESKEFRIEHSGKFERENEGYSHYSSVRMWEYRLPVSKSFILQNPLSKN